MSEKRLTTRDYKRPSRSQFGLNLSRWRDYGIGLAAGLCVAGIVYVADHRASEPAPAERPVPRRASASVGTDVDASGNRAGADPASPAEGKYDFYQMLPKFEVVVPEKERGTRVAPAAQIDRPGVYFLQAGSYRDITVAERQVASWQQQMDDMIIRAPFDGVITTKDAQPGEMISPVSAGGGFTRTGIGTIVDMASLEIEIDVNENYIERVQPSQAVEATLDAYPTWKIPCKVIAIIPTADRTKSTVKVRVGFDQLDPRILPDMSVKVAFHGNGGTTAAHTVLVPKNSVLNRDGRDVVFVVNNGNAERRAVTVTDTQNDNSVLSAGVTAGEKIIVNAPADLQDGTAVKEKKL